MALESGLRQREEAALAAQFSLKLTRMGSFVPHLVDIHAFGDNRRSDGSKTDPAPALVGVFNEFAYHQWCKEACRSHPMANCTHRGMRMVKGLMLTMMVGFSAGIGMPAGLFFKPLGV